jgi:hypothetical protein
VARVIIISSENEQNSFCRNKISSKLNGKIEIYFAEMFQNEMAKRVILPVHSEIV